MTASFTSDVTIARNAAPIITATARSRTLPLITNALKSLSIVFIQSPALTESRSEQVTRHIAARRHRLYLKEVWSRARLCDQFKLPDTISGLRFVSAVRRTVRRPSRPQERVTRSRVGPGR